MSAALETARGPVDLPILDESVERAVARGEVGDLPVIAYGEISVVVKWGPSDRLLACKRLPLFPDEQHWNAYLDSFALYLRKLGEAGVQPVETWLERVVHPDGRIAGYCVQRLLSKDSLMPNVLSACEPDEAIRRIDAICERMVHAVSPALGLDGQVSNWVLSDGELAYLDVSTPLIRDDRGAELLDIGLFLSSLPWALRGFARRFLVQDILDKYYDPRGVVLDLLGNLHKERLTHLLPKALDVANARVTPAITMAEVDRYYAQDARSWAFLQWLRRIDRAWQRFIRRRPYPFLLPGNIKR